MIRSSLALAAALSSLLVLGACASPSPRERDALRLQEFVDAAGPPVDSFNFFRMHRWQGLGPDALALWTRVNEVYLIRVDEPCFGLEFATTIGVTSSINRVSRRFDEVFFDNQRCRIAEIRPVDEQALRVIQRGRS